MQPLRFFVIVLSISLPLACGAATPEAEAPQPTKSDESASKDGDASMDDEGGDSLEPSEPEPPKGPNPRDVLLKDEASFVYNFKDSDEGKKLDEKCEASSKGDPAKNAKCVSDGLKKVTREGFAFETEDGDALSYIRFGIVSNKRVIYNKVKAELGEPTGAKIVVTTSGPDRAARRKGKVPAQIEIEVQDEYTIVIQDSTKGRCIYDTRLGLFAESEK